VDVEVEKKVEVEVDVKVQTEGCHVLSVVLVQV